MFVEAREIFRRIHAASRRHPDATREFEVALQKLVTTYDTALESIHSQVLLETSFI